MRGWTWNGTEMVEADGVSFADRGFRWGMSVFETLRVAEGRAQFVAEHVAALEQAAVRCGMEPDVNALEAGGALLLDPPVREGVARVYLSAGEGGVRSRPGIPRCLVFFEENPGGSVRVERATVKTAPADPVFAGLKTGNYWHQVHWLQEAVAEGFDEAVLLNADGTVRSACLGNLFLKTSEGWTTPDAGSGARMGVVRNWLLRGRDIVEHPIAASGLDGVTSMMITNSNLGVHPLREVAGQALEIPPEAADWQAAFLRAGF